MYGKRTKGHYVFQKRGAESMRWHEVSAGEFLEKRSPSSHYREGTVRWSPLELCSAQPARLNETVQQQVLESCKVTSQSDTKVKT